MMDMIAAATVNIITTNEHGVKQLKMKIDSMTVSGTPDSPTSKRSS